MIVLGVGTSSAAFAAASVASSGADQSREDLEAASAEVASTMQLALQRADDLVVSTRGFVLEHPGASNADLARWATFVEALARYPALQLLGFAVLVPAADLPAHAAYALTDPTGPLGSTGTFEVVPAGDRPFYCLSRLGLLRTPELSSPAGLDFCATGQGLAFIAARDSGRRAFFPYELGQQTWLAVNTPIYAGGVVPTNVLDRQSAFIGWVGTLVDPKVVLDRALQSHPGLTASMRYRSASSDATFHSGTPAPGARSVAIDLGAGWTVTTSGVVATAAVFTNDYALGVLVAGLLLSILVAALVFVLATGRVRALALVSDKTEELRHQALHDALTGLPNRALIIDRIEQLLARNRRHGTDAAALFVDLDEFKNVNDTLGHEAGDRLLQSVATRLTSSLRDVDTIGRMGGDEFVVLVDGGSMQAAPELVADRLLEVMRHPFELEGAPLPMIVTTSIGIAAGSRETAGELLRDADVALYQAKAAGKNCHMTFSTEMDSDVHHRVELEFHLRAALEGHQFRLVYQPIYNLGDLSLIGAEALIRWDHPTLGEIQPVEFISLLESSGQILDVGRWVLREACAQMATWRARGSDLMVSVNISGRQLDHDVIVDHVREALDLSGLGSEHLTLEITETALMRDVDTTTRRLIELKALGLQIAIDDFGTGYSSLAYLQRFPIDSIKIDRAFIDAVTRSRESDALIRTFVQLGKDLGLTVLAEGVETTMQMDRLREEHVHEAQGFLLARPLDPQTLETQLLEPLRPTVPTPTAPPT